MKKSLHIAVAGVLLTLGAGLSANSMASGFAIIENSASGMGQAFAGAAAVAEDPSTVYFNPAGMMYLEGTQVTVGMHIINSRAEFNDKGSTDLSNLPPPLVSTSRGGDGGDAGDTFFVPNFYYVQDFGGKYKIGLGVNAPFGLGTKYDNGWMGRYTSTDSELKSININPAIAFRANDRLSIGLGMNIQYLDATLKKDIYQLALPGPFSRPDGKAKVEGDSWELGFNIGFIYEITQATRLGMHYRSKISHKLEGDVNYQGISPALTGLLFNQDVTANIETPSTLSLSITHQLNNKLTILGDVTFTEWSNFDELKIVGDVSPNQIKPVTEKWDDAFRYSLGMKYAYNTQWTLRTGVAHDKTPIADRHRTSRIPGDDRYWLSFGAGYSPTSSLTIDAGYSHLWVDDTNINESYPLLSAEGRLNGDYDSSVNIFSVQGTWKF